jgi:MFS family permease
MRSKNRTMVTAGILLGMLLGALEATVVSTAMPTVVASLGGLEIYSWVFSAYLLTSTVTVPLGVSSPTSTAGFSTSCASRCSPGSIARLAQSMGQLVAFRAVQGPAGGPSLGMTIIAELYTPWKERNRATSRMGHASIAVHLSAAF